MAVLRPKAKFRAHSARGHAPGLVASRDKPRLVREPEFLLLGIEAIFDPEAVSEGAGLSVDAGLEGGDATGEIVPARVAVVVGDVLAQPAPERLDRHEIRAVARQRHQLDAQGGGRFPHGPGPVVGGAVPQHDQLAVGMFGAQPAEHRWVLSRSANPQPLQGFALRRRPWPGPTASSTSMRAAPSSASSRPAPRWARSPGGSAAPRRPSTGSWAGTASATATAGSAATSP